MDLGLTNKVVLVAGSSRGIGKVIAEAFLKEGAKVLITGRTADVLDATVKDFLPKYDGSLISYCGDLTQEKDILGAISTARSKWGELDCIVANIGTGRIPNQPILTGKQWHHAFTQNFAGGVRLAEAVVPTLQQKKSGSVVFVSSIAGVQDIGAPPAYAAAKSGIISYAQDLARRVASDGVRVNAVAPGNIFFEGGTWDLKMKDNKQAVELYIHSNVPMQRFGTPEEIANLVVFLSSNCSSFTTGACFVADGGQISTL